MSPDQTLIDQIYREKVLRARRMSPEEKLGAAFSLFEAACEMTRAGIRAQHPDADEVRVAQLLRERLKIGALLDEQSGRRFEKAGSDAE
jgi:hypothetical protein